MFRDSCGIHNNYTMFKNINYFTTVNVEDLINITELRYIDSVMKCTI